MASKTLDFKGGDKMVAKLREIGARLGPGGAIKVGFLEGATYPATKENPDAAGLPVAQVAFWNEFGTSRAPARPFFRNYIAQHSDEWPEALAAALKLSNYDTKQAFAIVGTVIKDGIVKSIVDTNSPALSPVTIKRKGFAKPLIDTGVMQRSVDYVVERH